MKFVDGSYSAVYFLTDENGKDYRRIGLDIWEERYGESWETINRDSSPLEQAFRDWLMGV